MRLILLEFGLEQIELGTMDVDSAKRGTHGKK
jgi:hypothetical protein